MSVRVIAVHGEMMGPILQLVKQLSMTVAVNRHGVRWRDACFGDTHMTGIIGKLIGCLGTTAALRPALGLMTSFGILAAES